MDNIILRSPDTYRPNDRVLFTCGPSKNRPGIVEAGPNKAGLYTVFYRFYLPVQRQMNGTRPDPREVLCSVRQLISVTDPELSRDQFLALFPDDVIVRYFT